MRDCLWKTPCAILLTPERAVRGGSFTQGPQHHWSSQRGAIWRNDRLGDLGFRVARNAAETRTFSQEVISAAIEALRVGTMRTCPGQYHARRENKGWSDITRWPCGGFVASPCLKPEKPAKHENTHLSRIP